MLDLMLNVRAWAEARPTYEDIKGAHDVRTRLDGIEKREETQGSALVFSASPLARPLCLPPWGYFWAMADLANTEITRKNVFAFVETVRLAIANLTKAAASLV